MSQSLAEGAFKAGDPAATSEVFTRNQRLGLIAIAVVAYGLTALIARPIGFFAEPEFGASLALDRFASTAIIKAAVWTFLVGVAGTFAGRNIRPDTGLFAASFAFLAIRRVGGTARDVYLQHPNPSALRSMALELLLLGLVLAAVHAVSRLLVDRGLLPDDEVHDLIRPKPEHLSEKLIALGASALTVGLVVLILCRSDERMQVTIALAVAGLAAGWSTVRFVPATPSFWYWAGPVVIGVIGYLVNSASPDATLAIGEPGGYAPALARALPLDYASAGVAGALYGYWIGRTMLPEDLRLPMSSEDLEQAKARNDAQIEKMAPRT